MFSSEYCKIFKNTYIEEHQLTAASDFLKQLQNSGEQLLLAKDWFMHYIRRLIHVLHVKFSQDLAT